jgi:hypothetical protein
LIPSGLRHAQPPKEKEAQCLLFFVFRKVRLPKRLAQPCVLPQPQQIQPVTESLLGDYFILIQRHFRLWRSPVLRKTL